MRPCRRTASASSWVSSRSESRVCCSSLRASVSTRVPSQITAANTSTTMALSAASERTRQRMGSWRIACCELAVGALAAVVCCGAAFSCNSIPRYSLLRFDPADQRTKSRVPAHLVAQRSGGGLEGLAVDGVDDGDAHVHRALARLLLPGEPLLAHITRGVA